ncbi:MAG: GDSL-type esterase/lipase family protein [Rhodomicrobium sp.]
MSFSIGCRSICRGLEGRPRERFANLITVLIFLFCGAAGAHAQGATPSSSYITPFPQGDRYQIRVIGDWFGAGLTAGLQDALKGEASLEVSDASRSGYGLVRSEQSGLLADADKMLKGPPVHIAIVMLGINDRLSMRTAEGHTLLPGSGEWKELYGREAEKLIKKLRNASVAVYWVGLPPMNNPGLNEFVAGLNDTIRQAAYLNGAKFIETSAGFTDQAGAYSAWGADISGQTKRLREGDGEGLTQAGYRKIASFAEISIRRDLAQARAQRNIPLAGDEEEQARVVPLSPRGSPAKSAGADGAKPGTGPASGWKADTGSSSKPDPAAKAAAGAKPEAPAAALPAPDAARRDQAAFAEAGGQQGEYILAELGDGLTSIAVITPVGDLSMREIQRQTPLADRVYFKVLSKGEALPPKEGRADDFRWHGEENTRSQ